MTFIQHTARAVFALHSWLPCGAPNGHHAALLALRQGPTAYLLTRDDVTTVTHVIIIQRSRCALRSSATLAPIGHAPVIKHHPLGPRLCPSLHWLPPPLYPRLCRFAVIQYNP